MRLQLLVFLALCVLNGTLAKIGSSRHHLNNVTDVDNRVETLKLNNNQEFIVPLNPQEFRNLIFATPRNHSAFVLFYNGNSKTCRECQEAINDFYQLAMAYHGAFGPTATVKESQSVFFVVVHVHQELRKLKLGVSSTKAGFYYFPESVYKKYNPYSKMETYFPDEYSSGMPTIAKWMKEVSGIFINTRLASSFKPSTFGNTILMMTTFGGLILFVVWRRGKWSTVYVTIRNVNLNYLIVLTVLWLISGQMFNHIRGSGLVSYSSQGDLIIIYPSQRHQLIIESLLVMMMYAIMCYNLVNLIDIKEAQVLEKKSFNTIAENVRYSAVGFIMGLLGIFSLFRVKRS